MISNNKIKSYGNAIINCKTIDGDVILIKEKLFRQSKTLDTMFLTCELEEKEIDLELPFSTDIVLKVIKWFENHLGIILFKSLLIFNFFFNKIRSPLILIKNLKSERKN